MCHKIIILSLALVVCFTALAIADGGFFGTVSYSGIGCGFSNGDMVRVLNTDTDVWHDYPISQQSPHGYDTENSGPPYTWPPGHYHLWVVKYQDPDCGPAMVQIVNHGASDQQVNLLVLGGEGTPDGPKGP